MVSVVSTIAGGLGWMDVTSKTSSINTKQSTTTGHLSNGNLDVTMKSSHHKTTSLA